MHCIACFTAIDGGKTTFPLQQTIKSHPKFKKNSPKIYIMHKMHHMQGEFKVEYLDNVLLSR